MANYEKAYYEARYDYRPSSMYWWSTRYYAHLVLAHAPRRGGRLLEAGYGMGHLLGRLEDHFQTLGVDISDYANREALCNAPRSQFISGDIEAGLALPDAHFAVIVAKHVLEHVAEPQRALAECARLLEPGGLLLFGTPNPTSLGAARKGKRWIGWSDPTHISVRPPADWLRMASQVGLAVTRAFDDGLWDVPYVPWVPAKIQLAFFGLPALLQILSGGTWMPVKLGESLLVIAYKQ